jgi:hypothetical protein
MRLATISLFLALLLSACQSSLLLDLATKPGDPLFWDDFSDTSANWPQASDEVGALGYSDGAYRITVQEAQYLMWAPSGQAFRDVLVQADAIRLAGPAANRFGLICGYRDPKNFYFFIISSDGYYGLGKIEAGDASLIGQEAMDYSTAIAQVSGLNHIQLQCADQTLRGAVNGQLLAEAQDDGLGPGDAGLLAGTFEEGGVEISFDNFVVARP